MTSKVIWAEEDTPFAALAGSMRQFRVSAFPVVNAHGLVTGIVSEADLLPKEALGGGDVRVPGMITGVRRHREMAKARGVTARDLMTSPAVTVSPGAPVEQAARLMYRHRVKRLPVTDKENRLIGIVTRSDVLSIFGRPDQDIREDVLARLAAIGALSRPDPTVSVAVRDGVVTFSGVPEPREAGDEIIGQARRVEGIVTVLNHFTCPPPAGPDYFDILARFPQD